MAEFDYPAVADEEEEKKAEPYPAVSPRNIIPVSAGDTEVAALPSTLNAPSAPLIDSGDYLGQSGASRMAMVRPAPSRAEYTPPERHGWAKFGSTLATLSPRADTIVNQRRQAKAENAYEAATKEHATDFSEQEKIAQEQRLEGKEKSEASLKTAQSKALEPQVMVRVPWQQEPIAMSQKGAEAYYKTQQQGVTSENVADTKAQSAEKIQGKSKSDVAEEGYASKEKIAENANKLKRELGMAKIAMQKLVGPKAPPEVAKAHSVLEGSISRLNIMQENKEKALQGDQQAMLSLLANHIGMTMGLVPGARINRQIYQEAEDSAPWLQRVEAHFDKDGFLSGVVLTPAQMEQMNDLAVNRLREDRRNLADTENYYGFHGKNEAAEPASANKPLTTPKVGDVQKGHRFKGGDPKDKNNWEKVAS